MLWVFEFLIAIILTYLFIMRENPKLKFLFYGYLFVLVSLLLQLPFKFIQLYFKDYFSSSFIPILVLGSLIIVVSELTKYFSLKRFLKTKSYKNGILFGIGWSTIESISFFSILIYSYIFSFFSINFDYSYFIPEKLLFFNFLFFFTLNLAITVFVIISIIKKNYLYLIYAIVFSLIVYILIMYLNSLSLQIFKIFVFLYSLYIIYYYRNIK